MCFRSQFAAASLGTALPKGLTTTVTPVLPGQASKLIVLLDALDGVMIPSVENIATVITRARLPVA